MVPDLVLDALGWGGSALLVISILQTRIDRLRWMNLAAAAALLIYNIALPVWPMVGLNAALLIINVVNLARLRRRRARRPDRVAVDFSHAAGGVEPGGPGVA